MLESGGSTRGTNKVRAGAPVDRELKIDENQKKTMSHAFNLHCFVKIKLEIKSMETSP